MIKKSIAISVLILTIYPILFICLGSFMGNEEVLEYISKLNDVSGHDYISFLFIPQFPTLRGYVALLFDTPAFFIAFWNSVKVTSLILVGQVVVNVPATWWFAQGKFKYRKVLYNFYIILMVLPFVVTMLPQYIVLKKMGLLDTHAALILPAIFNTLSIFVIYPYFKSIPKHIIESAKIDGASDVQIFWKIGVPMCLPAIIISVMLNLFDYWGSLEQILIFIKSKQLWTLPVFISGIELNQANLAFVTSVISIILPILFMKVTKKYLLSDSLNQAEEK
ncbi:carbohydrate ABC transporter permease [Vagococcus silagei]|uniref:Carbohydrate ABC transporter permease n=1 Tax=Vagococcus silagei TaxID=2508885 RepID=A0A4S3B739_9ENTE|nr:carbohydrate ABC transporter permease [Vagococcus silagei]THB60495.1 carbohydrate ABC transporter permease [Vagococcus silagei]